ncbi:MAG: hypothetical protein Q8R72_05330 [Hylemonella sp.]|nr:hypothetical protein [Hylemonella sp.]
MPEEAEEASAADSGFIKIFAWFLAVLLITIVVGLSLPSIVPGCQCGLEGGCRGCGGVIGDALGSFSLVCFALGAMGLVLLVWFGIPLVVLGGIVYGIYSLFRTKENKQTPGPHTSRANTGDQ